MMACGGEDPTGLRRVPRSGASSATGAVDDDDGAPTGSGAGASSSSGGAGASSSSGGPPGTSSGGAGTSSGGAGGGGPYAAELQACADTVNGFRAQRGLAPLARSAALEDFSAKAAANDGASGRAHGYFSQTRGGGVSRAENAIPGWPIAGGGITKVIQDGTQMMWNEGPGGGHYENIVGRYTEIGCGVFVTPQNRVWVVQNFR